MVSQGKLSAQSLPQLGQARAKLWLLLEFVPFGASVSPRPLVPFTAVVLHCLMVTRGPRPPHFQVKVPEARQGGGPGGSALSRELPPSPGLTCFPLNGCRWASWKLACSTRSCEGSRSCWMQPGSSQVPVWGIS